MSLGIRKRAFFGIITGLAVLGVIGVGADVLASSTFPPREVNREQARASASYFGGDIETHAPILQFDLVFEGQVTSNKPIWIFDGPMCTALGGDDNLYAHHGSFNTTAGCHDGSDLTTFNFDFCRSRTGACVLTAKSYDMPIMGWATIQLPPSLFTYDASRDISVAFLQISSATPSITSIANRMKLTLDGGYVAPIEKNGGTGTVGEFVSIPGGTGKAYDETFTFGAPCSFGSGSPTQAATLEWMDADHVDGPGGSDINIAFRLVNVTTNTTLLNVTGGAAIGGEAEERSIGFVAEAGHDYEWRWRSVRGWNDLEIRLPFAAVEYDLGCPPAGSNIQSDIQDLDCDAFRGWVYDMNNTSAQLDILMYIDGAYSFSSTADRPNTAAPAPNHGFEFSIPAAYRDGIARTISVRAIDTITGAEVPLNTPPDQITCHTRTATCSAIGLPTTVGIGQAVTTDIEMTNTGTEAWVDPEYELVSTGDNWGLASLTLPSLVGSGDTGVFTLNLTTPGSAGTYNFTYYVRHIPTGYNLPNPCTQSVIVSNIWDIDDPETTSLQAARNPGDSWGVTVRLNNSGSGDSYGGGGPGNGRVDLSFSFTLNGSSWGGGPGWGGIASPRNGLNIAGGSDRTETLTFTVPGGLNYTDKVCIIAQAVNIRGQEGSDAGITYGPKTNPVDSGCFLVAEQPYFEVQGGGLWAGGVVRDDNPRGLGLCSTTDTSSGFIRSVFNGTIGSITEHASFARGDITGIGTGKSPATDPEALLFENDTAKGVFQGDKARGRCMVDYYNYLEHSGSGVTVFASFPVGFPRSGGANPDESGQYFFDAGGPSAPAIQLGSMDSLGYTDMTATAGNKQITLIINGNVEIVGDISNDRSHVGGPEYVANMSDTVTTNDIPMFILVTTGDILIRGNVTRLDGLYVSREGSIDTCSDEPRALSPADPNYQKLSTNICTNQLTVNGSLVADDMHLRRTAGGIYRGGPAEIFRHSTDFNLAPSPFVSDLLPEFEILNIEDLPPIF